MSAIDERGPVAADPEVRIAAGRLDDWIGAQGHVGWDPHDLLNSPFLSWLDGPGKLRHVLGIGAVQLGRRSPLNLHRLLRVPKVANAKAAGLFLASYSRKQRCQPAQATLEIINSQIDWLAGAGSAEFGGRGWGYPFPWPNRAFYAPRGTPTVVNTSFIIHGLLDAYELLDMPGALALAQAGGQFIEAGLNRLEPRADELCVSYTPLDHRWVHNANALGASALARLASISSHAQWLELALRAARFTARRQRADGSWPYGEGSLDGWVDNFHTAFVIDGLQEVARYAPEPLLWRAVERGYALWKAHLLEPSGAPRYMPNRLYPIDVHVAAQAVLTLLRNRCRDADARVLASRVARWTIAHMQQRDGSFAYQIQLFGTLRVAYLRWSQAWMQRALTELIWQEHEASRMR